MSSLPTPPRLGARVPLPPPPRERASEGEDESADELAPGDLLEGRYQIEERIGEGGVGFVYRALQLKLHRRVAVKLLQQDVIGEEQLRPRFQQEALTLAALSHPHIVNLQDYGVVRGRPFLVMELLEGKTLRDIIDEEGALPPLRALSLLRQVVLALAYAHGLGIVHRDLKPANLIVQPLPAYEHVKVLDFGMVKLLPGSYLDRGQQLTRAGFTFGTPAYMSPEHAIGGDVDGRSDLYAVGVLLYELLTGEKPFDGEVQDILRHHLTTPVPRLADKRPELIAYPELQQIIERAMAKDVAERTTSAIELLTQLDQLLRSGLLADDDAEPLRAGAHAEERPSMGPKMREALESAAAALSSYARTSREVWRDKASPQLLRTRREVRALAARLAPKLRSLSEAAWARLKPQMLEAAQRIARLAQDAKQRLESAQKAAPRALPADTQLPDTTMVDVPPFAREGEARAGAAEAQTAAAAAIAASAAAATSVPAVLPRESAAAQGVVEVSVPRDQPANANARAPQVVAPTVQATSEAATQAAVAEQVVLVGRMQQLGGDAGRAGDDPEATMVEEGGPRVDATLVSESADPLPLQGEPEKRTKS